MSKMNPLSKFTCGNIESFNRIDIESDVRNFFNNYSPDIMKIVIISGKKISEIKNIINLFGKIPNKNQKNISNEDKIKDLYSKKLIFDKLKKNYPKPLIVKSLIKLIPYDYNDKLYIFWQIPQKIYNSPYGANILIDYMLNSRAIGSLSNILKSLFLIYELSYKLLEEIETESVIYIEIKLTSKGFSNIKTINNIIYDYIDKLKKTDLSESIEELKIILKEEFNTPQINNEINYINELSILLQKNVNPKYVLGYIYYISDYTEDFKKIFTMACDYIKENNSVIILSSKKYYTKDFNKSKHYSIRYKNINFDDLSDSENIKYSFCTPQKKNLFLEYPKKIFYKTVKEKYKNENSDIILIKNIKNNKIYWKFDDKFGIKTAVNVFIRLPYMHKSIYNNILAIIYFECINYILEPYIYYFDKANYYNNISIHKDSMSCVFEGFNEGIKKFILLYLDILNNFNNKNIFDIVKNKLILTIKNRELNDPLIVIDDFIRYNMENYSFSEKELLTSINHIKYKDIKKDLFNNSSVTILIQGYINKKKALELGELFNFDYKFNPFEIMVPTVDLIENIKDDHYIIKKNKLNDIQIKNMVHLDIDNVISVCCNIGYIAKDYKKYIILEICDSFINKKFYEESRVSKQLGYYVSTLITSIGDITEPFYQYRFIIQTRINIILIAEHIKEFINKNMNYIENISESELNIIKKSYISKLNNPTQCLIKDAQENFQNILIYKDLDYVKNLTDEIKKVKMNDIIFFYKMYIMNRKKSVYCYKGTKN
jgi:secreted Zn-dependent insulinase-like peptidase